jgi:predicted nucleic acid-binding protein
MPFDVDPRTVLELSKIAGVAAYDCVFVAAARSNDLPLVTFDKQLLATFPDTAILPANIAPWFARRIQRRNS